MRARDAVITRPSQVPVVRRGLFAALTLAAWSAFAWLLTPVLTLALWAVGLVTAYDVTVGQVGHIDPALLAGVAAVSAALALVLVGWAGLQRRRFSGPERRSRPADVAVGDVATALGATPEATRALREAQVVVVTLDDEGAPVGAVVRLVGAVPTQRGATAAPASDHASSADGGPARLGTAPVAG